MAEPQEQAPAPVLPEALLDEIIADLDHSDADYLERLALWLRESSLILREWTGGEDGWYARLSRWLEGVAVADGTADLVTIIIFGLVVVLILAALYGIYRLMRAQGPAALPAQGPEGFTWERLAIDPSTPIPRALQPAACFHLTCHDLERRGLLAVQPRSTNSTLARNAELPGTLKQTLLALANAADRAQYGAWEPTGEELEDLWAGRERLLRDAPGGEQTHS